jgi:hypothetical protein
MQKPWRCHHRNGKRGENIQFGVRHCNERGLFLCPKTSFAEIDAADSSLGVLF